MPYTFTIERIIKMPCHKYTNSKSNGAKTPRLSQGKVAEISTHAIKSDLINPLAPINTNISAGEASVRLKSKNNPIKDAIIYPTVISAKNTKRTFSTNNGKKTPSFILKKITKNYLLVLDLKVLKLIH